jgi:hypothetical protein
VPRQVLPQIQKERGDVRTTRGVAGAQPQLRDQTHLGQHRQQRVQTRLESRPRVTDGHALLMAVLVQEPRRIQVQRVTFPGAGQPIQAPVPESPETAQILPRRIKLLEEAREHGLAGDAAHAQQLGRDRIAAQIGHMRELARVTQQAVEESQRLFDRQQVIVGQRQSVRQRLRESLDPLAPPHPTPERGAARVRTEALLRKANGD